MWEGEHMMEVDAEGVMIEVDADPEGTKLALEMEAVKTAFESSGNKDVAIAGYRKLLDYRPAKSALEEQKEQGGEVSSGAPGGAALVSEGVQKVKEGVVYQLAKLYAENEDFSSVMGLLQAANDFFTTVPKARTAKIVRTVIDIVSKVPDSLELQVELCQQVIDWCKSEKRTFLRQRIQSRLANLMFEQGRYQEALSMVNKLLRALKKLDDKQLLVETHLIEARIHNALRNLPKSKAALTASRTAGNAIYIAPLVQAELDEMSGILHCEESDYKTSFSYFLEAFEAYDSASDPRALRSLKYMMLCKVLQGSASEVSALMSGKWGIKHMGEDLRAMAAVATAAKNRSLEEYDEAVLNNEVFLNKDILIRHHLDHLYDQLLESNLVKIIEPFSVVEIAHVADLIHLPVEKVERKLSQMILDKKIRGILDQGKGHLILYEESQNDEVYANGLDVITNMGDVVDSLFLRVQANLVH